MYLLEHIMFYIVVTNHFSNWLSVIKNRKEVLRYSDLNNLLFFGIHFGM